MQQNTDLRSRIAGQSAMAAVVEAEALCPPRGAVARIFGRSPLSAEARANYRGAVGELLVGSILDRLGHSWDVLHGVPLNSRPLDHFVIGRAGAFAIVVVNCQGDEVAVNGDELIVARSVNDAIVSARSAAIEVATAIDSALKNQASTPVTAVATPIPVSSLVVLVEPVKIAQLATPEGVQVITSMQLEQWLLQRPPVLSGEEVAAISFIAELNETWPQPQHLAQKSRETTRSFVRIHHEVRKASARRFVWVTGALIVSLATVWTLVSTLTTLVVNSG